MSENHTELMKAVIAGDSESAKKIITSNEADLSYLNMTDTAGNTALFYAVVDDQAKLVERLLANGADITCLAPDGRSLLELARNSKYNDTVQVLEAYQGKQKLVFSGSLDHKKKDGPSNGSDEPEEDAGKERPGR